MTLMIENINNSTKKLLVRVNELGTFQGINQYTEIYCISMY